VKKNLTLCSLSLIILIMDKPTQLKEPDFEELKKQCQAYIDYVASDDYHEDNDRDHYIFEEAMEAVFGKDVWKFINGRFVIHDSYKKKEDRIINVIPLQYRVDFTEKAGKFVSYD